ncbi:hypothetical protein EGH67_14645 [Klebsiella aerogenes]|uniref:Uncharacterized protein n=1 Tax=Klebsiella aerogenes (strain ATCC 13048 / DSM 30053 / CCUG 1429 / JCM 1235 / KCTC 2190 / NBRC 13534 / NCIMB 10102 / NCTC 10006 / CDC 819-56) TaxID=1028307 RepID=A0A0H3FUP4_KLEAK|nr:hypothetical protein EAE_23155 [Klebsiella aerogenes KCTC 2190]KLE69019.1 hypothetical protein YA16_06635 [Klebsiella aerogenes]KLE72733.1 hypothetical protein YA15_04685 [Klebsiella aerogenes]KLF07065.1 hypothetical protein YA26_23040 [Klebsiella aerogenes]KLF47098.1 hypothetical protein YA33_03925 [Klebsiella aerogenes]
MGEVAEQAIADIDNAVRHFIKKYIDTDILFFIHLSPNVRQVTDCLLKGYSGIKRVSAVAYRPLSPEPII